MTFEEALKKAREFQPSVNKCVEYENGYFFIDRAHEDDEGGSYAPFVILKEDGRMINFPTYLIRFSAPEIGEIKF